MIFCVLQDEFQCELNIREAGDIVGSGLDPSTWAQSILEPAGLDLVQLPSANSMEETECRQTDSMAAKL